MIRNILLLAASAALFTGNLAYAQNVVLPGSADSSRIDDKMRKAAPPLKPLGKVETKVPPPVEAPQGAEDIRFFLRSVNVKGAAALDQSTLDAIVKPYEGRSVTLKEVYEIAGAITRAYRDRGYLLSYAYIPDQEIASGNVGINVAEGYIGRIDMQGDDPNARITDPMIAELRAQKPVDQDRLESFLLRLNDLPGTNYRAVLSREPSAPAGENVLTLIPSRKSFRGSVTFDNYGSRYIGPNEISAMLSESFLPQQQTTLFALKSLPFNKLDYLSATHAVNLTQALTAEVGAAYTRSHPQYTLKPLEIYSHTSDFSAGLDYQMIRQRDENLLFKVALRTKNVDSEFLGTNPLSHDDIRMLEASLSYDRLDSWSGSNTVNLSLTRGLNMFGASQRGDAFLSRSEARPDFLKAEFSYSRLQALGENWAALGQASGQISKDPLFASEEFGVGGQSFGRAYDYSEIVGENGLAGSFELRYTGFRTLQPVNFEPFVYYDIGFVTNKDSGQPKRDSLASAGGGIRFATTWGQSGTFGLSVPLTRPVNAPIYGQGDTSPRIMLQIVQSF